MCMLPRTIWDQTKHETLNSGQNTKSIICNFCLKMNITVFLNWSLLSLVLHNKTNRIDSNLRCYFSNHLQHFILSVLKCLLASFVLFVINSFSCFSRVCSGGVLGSGLLELHDELHRVPDQGHEGAGHQIQAQEEQQVPLLLPERPRQSLGEYWLDWLKTISE